MPIESTLKAVGYAPGYWPPGLTGVKMLPLSLGLLGAVGGKLTGGLINKFRRDLTREERKFFSNQLARYGAAAGGLSGLGAIHMYSGGPTSATDPTPIGWGGIMSSIYPYPNQKGAAMSETTVKKTADFRRGFVEELARRGIAPSEVGAFLKHGGALTNMLWGAMAIPLLTVPYYAGKGLATATTDDPKDLIDRIKAQELSAAYRQAIARLKRNQSRMSRINDADNTQLSSPGLRLRSEPLR